MKKTISALIVLFACIAVTYLRLCQMRAALADMTCRHEIQKVVSSRRAEEIANLKKRIEILERTNQPPLADTVITNFQISVYRNGGAR